VALTLAVLDPPTGGLLLATAGMEPVLVVRAGSTYGARGAGAVETLDAGDLILGAARGVEYAAVRATLSPGDVLAITTDGLTEARPDGGAGQFALDGLGACAGRFGGARVLRHPEGGPGGGRHRPRVRGRLLPRRHLPPPRLPSGGVAASPGTLTVCTLAPPNWPASSSSPSAQSDTRGSL
jgi:hypothetical protein